MTYGYDAYGNHITQSGSTENPYRFTGESWDEEAGLVYLRQRYYDPSVRRFLTEDPAQNGGNWYAYCGNNPVNGVDPWGLERYEGPPPYAMPQQREMMPLYREKEDGTRPPPALLSARP